MSDDLEGMRCLERLVGMGHRPEFKMDGSLYQVELRRSGGFVDGYIQRAARMADALVALYAAVGEQDKKQGRL